MLLCSRICLKIGTDAIVLPRKQMCCPLLFLFFAAFPRYDGIHTMVGETVAIRHGFHDLSGSLPALV